MTYLSLPLLAFLSLIALPAQAEGLSESQKKEINVLIENYIKENPKVMLDSVLKFQEDQAKAEEAKMNEGVKNFVPSLKDNAHLPEAGSPKGDVTVVEFFDYNCGYCKKGFEPLQKLIKEDKNVRVVFIDLPILGPSSREASKWALAAHRQKKYFEYHQALMTYQGQKDEANLERIAKEVGLDVKQAKKDKEDPSIEAELTKNEALAASISVQGTPAFVVNDQIVRGYMEYDVLSGMVTSARTAKK